jgi:hypothetical protein
MLLLSICISLLLHSSYSLQSLKQHRYTHRDMSMQSSPSTHERIVVTGLGVVSPAGCTVPVFFDNICNSNSAVTKLTRFDASVFKCQIAGMSLI